MHVRVVPDVLITVGHHGTTPVPAPSAHDVHLAGQKGVRGADHGADVHVVLPIFDRHVKIVPTLIEIGHDGFPTPIPVPVHHVAAVTVSQQFGIEQFVFRPWTTPWTDPYGFPVGLVRLIGGLFHPLSVPPRDPCPQLRGSGKDGVSPPLAYSRLGTMTLRRNTHTIVPSCL